MVASSPIRLRRLVPIVKQQTHPHPRFSRRNDAVEQELTREVVVKDIVLQVESFFRPVRSSGLRVEKASIRWAGGRIPKPRVINRLGLKLLPQAGPFGPVKGAGDGARIVIRDGGAPVKEHQEQHEKRAERNSRRPGDVPSI